MKYITFILILLIQGCAVSEREAKSMTDYRLCEELGYAHAVSDASAYNILSNEFKSRTASNNFSLNQTECKTYMKMGYSAAHKPSSFSQFVDVLNSLPPPLEATTTRCNTHGTSTTCRSY